MVVDLFGDTGGGLAGVHSADLGAHVLKGLIERTQLDANAVGVGKGGAG